MEQDFKKIDERHCFSCIQWDGQRTYYPDKKVIKVDVSKEALCRISRKKIRGSSICERYFPMR